MPKKAYLDKLAGGIIRARGRCQNPKCVTPISSFNYACWSHIIPRDCLHLRWRLDNALCLCLNCEKYFTAHPLEQRAFFISIIGEDKYWELKRSENQYEKVDYGKTAYELNKYIKMQGIRINVY